MEPLIGLIVGTLITRLTGFAGVDALDGWQPALYGGIRLRFVLTGVAHFVPSMRSGMIAMVPPRLPAAGLLVTVTGIAELAGAVGVWIPGTARLASACLAVLLLVMFPANVSAIRRRVTLRGKEQEPLWIRTLLQLVFLAACLAGALPA